MKGTARGVARETLLRVDRDRAWATPTLDAALRRARLELRDAALATDLVYGVLRTRERLDRALSRFAPRGLGGLPPRAQWALRIGAYEVLFLRTPSYAAVDEAVRAVARAAGRRVAGFVNAALRRLATEGEGELPDADSDPIGAIVARESFPEWLAQLFVDELGASEAVAMAGAMNEVAPVTLRANLLRGSRDEAMRRIAEERPEAQLEPGNLVATAIVARGLGSVATLAAHRDGRVSVQDEGAQLVGAILGARAGERILDACAGVGGKTAQLAECMKDRGRLDALDRNARKLAALRDNLERLGLGSARTIEGDLLDSELELGVYDRVLLDAPCSGLGVLRRHPEARFRLRPTDIAHLVDVQRRMLDRIGEHVRPKGTLVYSVCSFLSREGKDQVASFLDRAAEFELVEERTTLPQKDGCDAFYVARLERAASAA